MVKGLIGCVYRSKNSGSSLNVIKGDEVLIVGHGIPEIFEACDLEVVELQSNAYKTAKCVPYGETRWTMFGGNFVYTTDSRFNEAIERITGKYFHGAIKLHDRVER
jgi:hypothetical protein